MSSEKTVPHPYFGRQYIGYVVNTPFSPEGQRAIQVLQRKYEAEFGDAIYIPSPETLHVTLMDWLAPLVDYHTDKDALFDDIYPEYDEVLQKNLKSIGSIAIHFDNVTASPEAVFIKGSDKGQYEAIRHQFTETVNLLPDTKPPAKIIHSTIARYLKEIDLQAVQDFTDQQTIDFTENIDFFRLIRSSDTTMDRLRVIKRYELK